MRRLKILISAYACSPARGSEPGMGWAFVRNIANHHDVWVITEKVKWEKEIQRELKKKPELNDCMNFFYIPKVRHKKLRKIWPPSYYWFYRDWQKKAYDLSLKLSKKIDFDIVHQLNMVGFREPGYLWQLKRPFVWGPVGGMVQFPYRFLSSLGITGRIFHVGRNTMNYFQSRYLPRVRKAAQKTNGNLIVAISEMQGQVKKYWGVESVYLSEIGQAAVDPRPIKTRRPDEPLRLCWSGLHLDRKALPLLLEGLHILQNDVHWHLDVLGLGQRTNAWKNMAERLNISEYLNWHGWLEKKNAMSIMANAHLHVITSLNDLSSSVTLEALSQGVPVLCLDHCGFKDIVTADCGVKIPVTSPKQVAEDLAENIREIYFNEPHRQELAKGALARSQAFSWENKMDVLNALYENALKTGNRQI